MSQVYHSALPLNNRSPAEFREFELQAPPNISTNISEWMRCLEGDRKTKFNSDVAPCSRYALNMPAKGRGSHSAGVPEETRIQTSRFQVLDRRFYGL